MQHKGEHMANINSALILQKMVFDKIEFERTGFKNDNELKFDLQVQIGTNEEKIYKVTLVLNGNKQEEYNLSITEIASRLSITEQVVRNQLSAALKVLRRELSNYSYLFILFTIYF